MQLQALAAFDPRQFFTARPTSDAPAQRADAQVSGVDISNDFSGRLSVTTDDGDRITLTADVESDLHALNYASHVSTDQTTTDIQVKYLEYSLKSEFGVAVEGDLDEQELHDLEKLFRKVSHIFRDFLHGQDDEALNKTAKLGDRFDHLSSLSSLDLSVNVERSITLFAAEVVSEVTGKPLPTVSQPQPPSSTSSTGTPGGAPATAAAIPQPSNGTTAPTPPPANGPSVASPDARHLTVPTSTGLHQEALVEQVLRALKDAKVEAEKIHKYLPDFLKQLREDLAEELRGERKSKGEDHDHPVAHGADETHPPVTAGSLIVAYQSVTHASFSLSIHS